MLLNVNEYQCVATGCSRKIVFFSQLTETHPLARDLTVQQVHFTVTNICKPFSEQPKGAKN